MSIKDAVIFTELLQEYERASSVIYRTALAEQLIDAHEVLESTSGYDAPAMRALHAVEMLIEHIESETDPTANHGYFRAKDARDLLRLIVADSLVATGRGTDSKPEPAPFCADGLVEALTADDTGAHPAAAAE